MSGSTEIYICQPGQEIKQGKLEISEIITTREAAMADAAIRSNADTSIAVIAYYAVDENGHVEDLYSYEASGSANDAPRSSPSGAKAGNPKGARNKAVPKKSPFRKIRAVFEA